MKTVVSLTTIPSRVDNVHHIIDMLLKQSYKPDSIILYVAFDKIPDKLRDMESQNPIFQIKQVKDMGSGTKWYYSLKDDNDIVIFLDDDVFIHHNLLEELIGYHTKYPSYNLGFIGTTNNIFVHNEYLVYCDRYDVDLLGGYRSVLVPWNRYTSSQKESLISSFELLCDSSNILDDDYFLSKAWKHIDIKASVVKSKHPWAFQFAVWSSTDNLNNEKNEEKMIMDRRRIDTFFS